MRTLLYAGNILDSATAVDLEHLFRPHGMVVAAEMITDPRTGRSLGYGFVEMSEGAEAAIRALHGAQFQGNSLIVRKERQYPDEYVHDESPEFRRYVEDLRARAESGDPEVARELADILYLPGPYYDPQAAYKWYYIALSQQGYTVGWQDDNHNPPHYCGPVGDFRNECMVGDLVVALGWDRIRQLDKEADVWMAQRNLTKRCT
jgi:RNA recognition motif-containing protein